MLEKIKKSSDVKVLTVQELKNLAKEIRQVIVDVVTENGGHLASNLGVVELTIAMHYVFDPEKDVFLFDVGHQCYTHKILTGRLNNFSSLRKKNGISGFPKREECNADAFNTGHSSTSLSAACGFLRSDKLNGKNRDVISIVGDGALTGGLCYEALNDGGTIQNAKQIIILNDNSMSISRNVGAVSSYLLKLHGSDVYRKFKNNAIDIIDGLRMENDTVQLISNIKNSIKYALQGGLPFDQYNLKYFGPVDGNNIEEVIDALRIAKEGSDSVILHAVTKKGKGYRVAEDSPSQYHGMSPTGGRKSNNRTYSQVFSDKLNKLAQKDNKIVAVTAAMAEGTGLKSFSLQFPDRFYDVGIAEAHAVTMSAAMAAEGLKPYFAVYSSFLQRAFDSVLHDVCLQNLPVRFVLDRAGFVPDDGETHQGIYDLSFLRCMPNMTIVSPASKNELEKILEWSVDFNSPLTIRYPKGEAIDDFDCDYEIECGKWNILKKSNQGYIYANGSRMLKIALEVEKELSQCGIDVGVINASFVKPIDKEMLTQMGDKKIIVMEENVECGGFSSAISEFFADKKTRICTFSVPDKIFSQASIDELMEEADFTVKKITEKIKVFYAS